ncbi:MAG TPA: ABC transporter ATP-binding protein [Parafilimonas sp.]|nr:ABC transporter ATP-binding protein [Parafilimonas sp.]
MLPAAVGMGDMLTAKDIKKKYGQVEVLKGVDLTINNSEIVCVVGSSGAGKSTLLHILGTLDIPDSGEIFLNNVPMHSLKGKKLADFRNHHIGFVFQFHHLLPEFTALENVCIPSWMAGNSKKQTEKQAFQLLETLGLKDRIDNKPSQLSGGEQQRVAVARALINKPDIVFADEPTGNLDSVHARELHNLFIDLRNQFKQTFLIVTHNEEMAEMSDRILHMKDGRIV